MNGRHDPEIWNGNIDRRILFSRDFMGEDQYRSRFALPVESRTRSLEHKKATRGQGPALKRFLKGPVRTAEGRTAKKKIPGEIYNKVERFIVGHQRQYQAYMVELVGCGAPSIAWRLKRRVSRRAMRYNPVRLLGAKNPVAQKRVLRTLEAKKPYAVPSEYDRLKIDHWIRDIEYTLRLTAFPSDDQMEAYIAGHPRPVDYGAQAPIDAAGISRLEWFEQMGWFELPQELLQKLRPKAKGLVLPEGSIPVAAYDGFRRGPGNLALNLVALPFEMASLYDRRGPVNCVFTKYECFIRLAVYVPHEV